MTAGAGPQATDPVAAVRSVDRALTVLELLAARGALGVTELAAALGVHKSTASRLVSVLEGRGYVEQVADRGKYRLGAGVSRLAGAVRVHRDLAQESRPACEALAVDVGETVNVAILDGDRVVNISQVRGPAAVAAHNWVGQSTPPHATASGKVLLAGRPALDLRATLGATPARYTPGTLTDLDLLRAELDAVRDQGWASTVEEYEVGLNALAVPVRDHEGAVVAAVSVSGPSYRLPPAAFADVLPRLLQAGAAIGRRLGSPA